MLIEKFKSNKTVFTRMCIAEAVIALLAYHELKQLKVYDVVRKAGVSRMTFYKYYASPQAALEDYLNIIVEKFIEEDKLSSPGQALSYEHILFALNFFDQYRDFFIISKTKGLYALLLDTVNNFVAGFIPEDENFSLYRRYAYAGSLLNCFLSWEMSGKKESAEDVARAVYELFGREIFPAADSGL